MFGYSIAALILSPANIDLRGNSPEKWVGVNPVCLLGSTKSSQPPWHLLGSDFVV